ncbi:MAG: hypothetical protein EOM45_14865, partial [Clostridia bacterium]|nr:hypothetical protein [Clostridia bacterium]
MGRLFGAAHAIGEPLASLRALPQQRLYFPWFEPTVQLLPQRYVLPVRQTGYRSQLLPSDQRGFCLLLAPDRRAVAHPAKPHLPTLSDCSAFSALKKGDYSHPSGSRIAIPPLSVSRRGDIMRKLIPLLLSIVLILASCELFTDEPVAGDVYAIMVGLDYQNNSQRDLYGTINDANELDLAFKSVTQQTGKAYFGYKFLQIGSSFVSSTTHTIGSKSVNSYPSLSNLKEAIAALKDITQKDDLILFTYSGHGNDDGTIALGSSSYSDAALSPVQEILDSFVDNDI